MPETFYEIPVSRREIDRARLIECVVVDRDGLPVEGVRLDLRIENDGTFDIDTAVTTKQLVSGGSGLAYVTWWEFPRYGARRDFISRLRVSWEDESLRVWVDNLQE